MKKYKKIKFVISVALVSVLVLSGCASVASQDVTTQTSEVEQSVKADNKDAGKTVTTHDGKKVDVSGVTLRIAAASGANGQQVIEAAGLDDTPYKVDFTIMQGGNLVMEALAANQIDLGAGSQIPPLSAYLANNGGNFKVIAVRYGSTINQELIVGPNSEIKSVAELKGKKVGYVKNTSAHYFLSKMLTEAGLEWSDIDAQPLTTSDGLTAVLTGEVEAFASYGNSVTSAKEKGATTLRSAQDILSGNYLFYATPAVIEDEAYHAAIEDWLRRWHEAHEWARQNPEKWAEYYAPTISMDTEDYLKQFEEENADKVYACKPITDAVVADEQDIANSFESLGLLQQHINAEELFDYSFVDAVSAFTQYD